VGHRRSSPVYKAERKKYKQLFAEVKVHHMHPHERKGDDTEFNLFPWNQISHDAWHTLFSNLTVQEVWSILDNAWEIVWNTNQKGCKPVWRGEYRFFFKNRSEQAEFSRIRTIGVWQELWCNAFGGSSLEQAKYLMRAMMLTMVFGHRAFTSDMEDPRALRFLVSMIPAGSSRAWAFKVCFGKSLATNAYGALKRQIRCILQRTIQARS
jgi:hypothetical protein